MMIVCTFDYINQSYWIQGCAGLVFTWPIWLCLISVSYQWTLELISGITNKPIADQSVLRHPASLAHPHITHIPPASHVTHSLSSTSSLVGCKKSTVINAIDWQSNQNIISMYVQNLIWDVERSVCMCCCGTFCL